MKTKTGYNNAITWNKIYVLTQNSPMNGKRMFAIKFVWTLATNIDPLVPVFLFNMFHMISPRRHWLITLDTSFCVVSSPPADVLSFHLNISKKKGQYL